MKVIITGDGVDENNLNLLHDAIIASELNITQILSGAGKGGDKLGEKWAKLYKIGLRSFPPNWKDISVPGASIKHGKFGPYNAKAGFDRNEEMINAAEAVIVLEPNGHKDMNKDIIERARKKNIPVFIYPQPKAAAESSSDGYVYSF